MMLLQSLSLHFFICKMGLLIAPTSQDWYEELNETMPGQLPAQCLARSRCSLNLSCDGPFQALSTPQAWAQAEVAPQHPQLTASDWQSPQARGPSLFQVSRVCVLEGASRELGVVCGDRASGRVDRSGGQGALASRPFRSPVACLVAHRDLQCDSPGGRAEGEWLGFPWNPGDAAKRREALLLIGLPGPLLKFDREWSP